MMQISPASLQRYLDDDWVMAALDRFSQAGDDALASQRWLRDSAAKRHIYACLYSDLLRSQGLTIVDVGGGFNCLTRVLAERHHYNLIEMMAHDAPEQLPGLRAGEHAFALQIGDWYEQAFPASCDVVVANDLFPNVDQRLELFLERALPRCREVRLSLTYHDEPKFYLARRLDGEEVLCMLGWSGADLSRVLKPYAPRLINGSISALVEDQPTSVFANRRQVCVGALRGDLPPSSGLRK